MKDILNKILRESDTENIYNFIYEKTQAISDEREIINYSDIATFVFDINPEDKEYVYKHLSELKAISEEKENSKVNNIIRKITSHIELETCRLEYLEEKQRQEIFTTLAEVMGNTPKKVESMKEKIDSCSNEIDKHNEQIKNWYTNI